MRRSYSTATGCKSVILEYWDESRQYLIYDDGIVNRQLKEVVEGDILDDATAHIRTRPSLDSGTILGIRHGDVASRQDIQSFQKQ